MDLKGNQCHQLQKYSRCWKELDKLLTEVLEKTENLPDRVGIVRFRPGTNKYLRDRCWTLLIPSKAFGIQVEEN